MNINTLPTSDDASQLLSANLSLKICLMSVTKSVITAFNKRREELCFFKGKDENVPVQLTKSCTLDIHKPLIILIFTVKYLFLTCNI